MSVVGGDWTKIFPVDGYTHRIRAGGEPGPWPPETEVYSGSIDWAPAVFELSGYSGEARFRFRFGSDGGVTREGWYVDEIEFFGFGDLSGVDEETPLVLHPAVGQNQPNPFGPETAIHYHLARPGTVQLKIYDAAGRLVRTLVSGRLEAGAHWATWDGRSDRGHEVESGVYLYRFEVEGTSAIRKMILTR